MFFFPIQLLFSHMSRPFSSKYWTLYSTRTPNFTKSGTLQITGFYVRSANVNHKQCGISFMIALNSKDILTGLLTPELSLLNYLLLIGKMYLWACRRNKELPSIPGLTTKVKLKYETEKHICTKNNNLDMFRKKRAI